jgi:hypothetical protein
MTPEKKFEIEFFNTLLDTALMAKRKLRATASTCGNLGFPV